MNIEEFNKYNFLKKLAETRFLKQSDFRVDTWLDLDEQIEYKQLQIKYLEM